MKNAWFGQLIPLLDRKTISGHVIFNKKQGDGTSELILDYLQINCYLEQIEKNQEKYQLWSNYAQN